MLYRFLYKKSHDYQKKRVDFKNPVVFCEDAKDFNGTEMMFNLLIISQPFNVNKALMVYDKNRSPITS